MYNIIKRVFDILLSLIMMVVLSPLFLVLIIAVKIDEPKANVFYLHQRVGKNDRKIQIIKFRSMVADADNFDAHFTEEQKKAFNENFKLEDDPRITKLGRILRKTSLDELPQLINILAGQLSFVGPRPVVEEEAQRYGDRRAEFLSVVPGLTGYWAVNGRNLTDYQKRIELELYYVNHCSVWLDLKIMFKTVAVVFTGRGAG